MITVVPIVEGDGEVGALPALLHRIGARLSPGTVFKVNTPIRVKRDQFLRNRDDRFDKVLQFAASKGRESGWILILLDADDDCPKALGEKILQQARQVVPYCAISVVLANCEIEAWFIAAAASLHGECGLAVGGKPLPDDPETIRNAKGWLSEHMPNGSYKEVRDQPLLSRQMNLKQAWDRSRSFRKLCTEWHRQMPSTSQDILTFFQE